MSNEDMGLRKAEYHVATVDLDTCRDLVIRFHYAKGGPNTATYRHGLFRVGNPLECLGVAWWVPPTRTAAEFAWDGDFREVLCLCRLVIHPIVPKNGASYLLGQSIRMIRDDGRYKCLITYADSGLGHTGAIYRATNWEYMGLTDRERVYVDQTGRMLARKAGPRTRTHAQMLEIGATVARQDPKHRFRMVLK